MWVSFQVVFSEVHLEMIGDENLVTDLQRRSVGRTTHKQLLLQPHDAAKILGNTLCRHHAGENPSRTLLDNTQHKQNNTTSAESNSAMHKVQHKKAEFHR